MRQWTTVVWKSPVGALCAVMALIALAGVTSAGTVRHAKAPRRAGAVLYRINQQATPAQMIEAALFLTQHRVRHDDTLHALRVEGGRAPLADFDEEAFCEGLRATGAVDWAEPDYLLAPAATTPNDPLYSNQWQHTKIQSPLAWDLTTGASSILVAVCDTGVQSSHPDLAANLQLPGYNAVDGGSDTEPINQHGTFCAGCIAAVGNNGAGVAGVAWSAKILPVKISNNSDGTAFLSDMAEGVQWAADQGAKLINLSYSGFENSAIDAAAQYARARGALLLMAAGNESVNLTGQPDWSSFLLVGSTDSNDARSTFSNYGVPIDLVAPGTSVVSTTMGSSYAAGSGTSYATPIAVGVAALMLSENASLSVPQLEARLLSACDDIGPVGDDSFFGRGRVNAYQAVTAATQGSQYPAEMSSPADGSTLSGSTVTFSWIAGGEATQYWLDIGSQQGAGDLFSGNMGLNLSTTVSNLPANGATVYVRLHSLVAGSWQHNDYTYTAYTSAAATATITSPTNGATLSGDSQLFQWNAGEGASQYWISLGSSSGWANYLSANVGGALSVAISGLPTDGSTLYVRLWTRSGATWLYEDYSYTTHTTAATPASMTSPSNGATLSGSSATFQWSAASGARQYWFSMGSAPGAADYVNVNMGTGLSLTVAGLPVDGSSIYVRLWTRFAASWHYNDYTYIAFTGALTPASISSPSNGSTLSSSSVTFSWSGIPSAQQYWLEIGDAPGRRTYYAASVGLSTSRTVNTLPTNGSQVYVRLYTRYGQTWVHSDSVYTASGP